MGLADDLKYRKYLNPNSRRSQRIRQVMDDLHAEGIQPTGSLIHKALGGSWGIFGLCGRDAAIFSVHMEELGYVKRNDRWRPPEIVVYER